MIEPIIFTLHIGNFTLALHWYGVLAMLGTLIGGWVAAKEVARRRESVDHLWDGLLWAVPAGIIGARLWYVVNDILGGGTRYLEKPISIINIPEGGLHFYGGILFGALAFYLYARKHNLDMWLITDATAPSLLIGQAIARPANFINQELYGPPTDLPWGIPIEAAHRIQPWTNLTTFPEETTRFHPTFAYEIIWNAIAAGTLLWLARRFPNKIRPGVIFFGYFILEGFGRAVIVESFRPDQPRIPGTDLSYSRLIAALMCLVGILLILIRYEKIRLPFIPAGPKEYKLSPQALTESTGETNAPSNDQQVAQNKKAEDNSQPNNN